MRILLLLLCFPVLILAQYFDVPCQDNAASTVVVNNGTSGSNWVANVNTDVIHNATYGLRFSGDYHMKSADNVTLDRIRITWDCVFDKSTETTQRYFFGIDADGIHSVTPNTWFIQRGHPTISGTAEFDFSGTDASGNYYRKATSGLSITAGVQYTFVLTVDATVSPWDVTLTQDGDTVSWGAWNGTLVESDFNDLMWFGSSNNVEPDAYIENLTVSDMAVSDENETGFPKFKQFPKFKE